MTPPPRTCAFCSASYDASAAVCPSCRYPADGTFDAGAKPGRTRKAPKRPPPADTCPNCGEDFPAGRPACPHCGADAETGWKGADELDMAAAAIPEFDDDDHRRTLREHAPGDVRLWTSRQVRMLVIGVVLVLAMVVPLLLALRRLP